jgi:hypothetical protein
VPSVNEARAVSVGLGLEVPSTTQRAARPHGHLGRVTGVDGTATTAGNVMPMPKRETGWSRHQYVRVAHRLDGSFSMAGGRHFMLRARGDDTDLPQFALQLTVDGADRRPTSRSSCARATITDGDVPQPAAQAPDPATVRVAAVVDAIDIGRTDGTRRRTRTFTLSGVQAGSHLFGPRQPRWTLKSVTVNGRDVIDTPISMQRPTPGDRGLHLHRSADRVDGTIAATATRRSPTTPCSPSPPTSSSGMQSRHIMTRGRTRAECCAAWRVTTTWWRSTRPAGRVVRTGNRGTAGARVSPPTAT